MLDNEFWSEQGGAEGWAELLGTDPDAVELRLLRRCTYAGRPDGEPEYVAEFEQRFGRVWRQWGFEKERHVVVSAQKPANRSKFKAKSPKITKVSEPTATLAEITNRSYQAERFAYEPLLLEQGNRMQVLVHEAIHYSTQLDDNAILDKLKIDPGASASQTFSAWLGGCWK